jgi:ParB family transcriptional regulator, chromosome partitioning protein
MPILDLHQLDLRYANLRIADPIRRARLEQALAREGQQVPVLVLAGTAERHVLIEGYGRVEALRRLARDTVQATVLDMGEAEALVLRHRLDHGAPRSALEEGWLVTTLLDCGKSQVDVAIALVKSTAWVSRRLALVRTLPEVAQEAVRAGRIGPSAAEKFLVPLSRGNAGQCAKLVEGLRTVKPTARQLLRIYTAWKAANDEVRQRIVDQPLLYLKVDEALKHTDPDDDADLTAVRDIEAVAGMCGRARKGLREGTYVRLREEHRAQFASAWREARLAFDAVKGLVAKEGVRDAT